MLALLDLLQVCPGSASALPSVLDVFPEVGSMLSNTVDGWADIATALPSTRLLHRYARESETAENGSERAICDSGWQHKHAVAGKARSNPFRRMLWRLCSLIHPLWHREEGVLPQRAASSRSSCSLMVSADCMWVVSDARRCGGTWGGRRKRLVLCRLPHLFPTIHMRVWK